MLKKGSIRDLNFIKIDRKSTRLNSSHLVISYAVFCLKKKKTTNHSHTFELQPKYINQRYVTPSTGNDSAAPRLPIRHSHELALSAVRHRRRRVATPRH